MSKPKRNITPEAAAQVEALAAHGHTQEEIAGFLGIDARSFRYIKKENEYLTTSYNRGRFKCKNYVLSRLMRYIKSDELTAVNLNAIQFYLRNTGFGTGDNNKVKIPVGNKSAVEILNGSLNALEKGEISVFEAQQLGNLAITKMNIEKDNPIGDDKELKITIEVKENENTGNLKKFEKLKSKIFKK